MVPILVLFTIILFLTIDYFYQRALRRRVAVGFEAPEVAGFDGAVSRESEELRDLPAGVFVAPSHVWTQIEPSGTVRVGVDRLLLSVLGGLDAVYGHPEGFDVQQGGPLIMLRNGQRALKIRSPVDGTVSEVNHAARHEPGRLYADPFQEGWIYRIQPTRLSSDLKAMRVAEEAQAWMHQERQRLRDLLIEASTSNDTAAAALADGGLPVANASTQLGDREWEVLVARFFGKKHPGESPSTVQRVTN